ncbi:hypothetical protein B5G26_14190 [Anaerotignum lactatifermentans]|uniref:Uncharacterized protein n=1 Tax=Anaerotignum lactatifermentans TaxID=160404 RepID=A0A1Y3U0F2_9FIRM|nr:hypothetical protein [Anaerotignum lactatifermentans]OUN40517.1 hypothetical protein B5G26_14190 [Anaerotignum lactatifermentans]
MAVEDMFGDLQKIDILAEKRETNEVLMVLVCNGFIDGSPQTQKALLDKMEGYLNHTQSEVFQEKYADWSVILRVLLMKNQTSSLCRCSISVKLGQMTMQ